LKEQEIERMPTSRVALVRGDDRYTNVSQALERIADDIDLSNKQRVLVKPNFVLTHKPLAATHVDAVRAVLDFVRGRYDGALTIAEGPSSQPAAEGFSRYGYEPLVGEYDVALVDLNHDDSVPVDVYDWRLRALRLHLAQSVVDCDYRISVGPPKTHDEVIVTLSLKNMIMGSLISKLAHTPSLSGNGKGARLEPVKRIVWRLAPPGVRHLPLVEWLRFRAMSLTGHSDKMKMHQSHAVINLNLALIAPKVAPHLAVIDGYEAMEGNGPTEGTPVPLRVALASADALAADVVGAALMGFDANEVGYLYYCKRMGLGVGELDQIDIVGNAALADCSRQFRPHETLHRQRRWKLPKAEALLP
jgi:uncharacterized protein (DUF362 family)